MSNKRNTRRGGQRVRSEVDRKPSLTTKARLAAVAAFPQERSRKEQERRWRRPTKNEKLADQKRSRRWRRRGPRKIRKPRTMGTSLARHDHNS